MARQRRSAEGDDEGRRPPRRAAAVRYNPKTDSAPRVVAAGEGTVADAIIEEARRHGVPLYKDPSLAEALAKLPVGTEIPPRLYVAIARVLAFVYQLDQTKQREGRDRTGPPPPAPSPEGSPKAPENDEGTKT